MNQPYQAGAKQPMPIGNSREPIADLLIALINQRKAVGLEEYKVPLQAFNGRSSLEDLLAELLDASKYTLKAIHELVEFLQAIDDLFLALDIEKGSLTRTARNKLERAIELRRSMGS